VSEKRQNSPAKNNNTGIFNREHMYTVSGKRNRQNRKYEWRNALESEEDSSDPENVESDSDSDFTAEVSEQEAHDCDWIDVDEWDAEEERRILNKHDQQLKQTAAILKDKAAQKDDEVPPKISKPSSALNRSTTSALSKEAAEFNQHTPGMPSTMYHVPGAQQPLDEDELNCGLDNIAGVDDVNPAAENGIIIANGGVSSTAAARNIDNDTPGANAAMPVGLPVSGSLSSNTGVTSDVKKVDDSLLTPGGYQAAHQAQSRAGLGTPGAWPLNLPSGPPHGGGGGVGLTSANAPSYVTPGTYIPGGGGGFPYNNLTPGLNTFPSGNYGGIYREFSKNRGNRTTGGKSVLNLSHDDSFAVDLGFANLEDGGVLKKKKSTRMFVPAEIIHYTDEYLEIDGGRPYRKLYADWMELKKENFDKIQNPSSFFSFVIAPTYADSNWKFLIVQSDKNNNYLVCNHKRQMSEDDKDEIREETLKYVVEKIAKQDGANGGGHTARQKSMMNKATQLLSGQGGKKSSLDHLLDHMIDSTIVDSDLYEPALVKPDVTDSNTSLQNLRKLHRLKYFYQSHLSTIVLPPDGSVNVVRDNTFDIDNPQNYWSNFGMMSVGGRVHAHPRSGTESANVTRGRGKPKVIQQRHRNYVVSGAHGHTAHFNKVELHRLDLLRDLGVKVDERNDPAVTPATFGGHTSMYGHLQFPGALPVQLPTAKNNLNRSFSGTSDQLNGRQQQLNMKNAGTSLLGGVLSSGDVPFDGGGTVSPGLNRTIGGYFSAGMNRSFSLGPRSSGGLPDGAKTVTLQIPEEVAASNSVVRDMLTNSSSIGMTPLVQLLEDLSLCYSEVVNENEKKDLMNNRGGKNIEKDALDDAAMDVDMVGMADDEKSDGKKSPKMGPKSVGENSSKGTTISKAKEKTNSKTTAAAAKNSSKTSLVAMKKGSVKSTLEKTSTKNSKSSTTPKKLHTGEISAADEKSLKERLSLVIQYLMQLHETVDVLKNCEWEQKIYRRRFEMNRDEEEGELFRDGKPLNYEGQTTSW